MPIDFNRDFNRPRLFTPSTMRKAKNDESSGKFFGNQIEDSNNLSSSSFSYDGQNNGLKSTQQMNLDFSRFENHTFFNSAIANVNVAFDRIINGYPFDGYKKEKEAFLESLTGFEKYVFDSFPKNVGYLFFSGSDDPSGGSYIKVNDRAGVTRPVLSRLTTGESILDPDGKSLSIEMHLFVPSHGVSTQQQIICQKLSSKSFGFTLALDSTSPSVPSASVVFTAVSGTKHATSVMRVQKGEFNHICAVFDRSRSFHEIRMYLGDELRRSYKSHFPINAFGEDFRLEPLYIGSGTQVLQPGRAKIINPTQTLSGAIDDFKIFHSIRTPDELKTYGKKSVYADDNLKLYFKFNEPHGIRVNDLVLDSSGGSLHSKITNYTSTLRNTGSVSYLSTGEELVVPLTHENRSDNPVLFPAYQDVMNLNSELLTSASNYDNANPNLITKLVPAHYLLEGAYEEGFREVEGTIEDSYAGNDMPGSGELGSPQILSAFLYVWAKHFDELKVSMDVFANLIYVDYFEVDTIPDNFLSFLAKYYGFDMPSMFSNASLSQFLSAEDIGTNAGVNEYSLQAVQNRVWRQVLTNLQDVIKSKGTLHSIKSLIRSIGIDPDTTLRIREYGGPTKRSLSGSRETRARNTSMLDFSGSLTKIATSTPLLDFQGRTRAKVFPFIISPFLSGSRVEVGYPNPTGTMVKAYPNPPFHGISNNANDGLFTSGSWTYEGVYRLSQPVSGILPTTQSLARLHVTGTGIPARYEGVLFNLIATSGSISVTGSNEGSVTLYGRPSWHSGSANANILKLSLTGTEIFDGDRWHVSFGRHRNDEIGSVASASYFLRAAKAPVGEITKIYTTQSYFLNNTQYLDRNALEHFSTANNKSGLFVAIGSQSLNLIGRYLNDRVYVPNVQARETRFAGKIGQMRFWSKALRIEDWKEHVKNFQSLGVKNPKTNFNFVKTASGSFQRLRLDASMEQEVSSSDSSGEIKIFDYSQNDMHLSASGFEKRVPVLSFEKVYYTQLSTKLDENTSTNKVRIRSYLDPEEAFENEVGIAPVYSITPSERPQDDPRLSIDFSVVNTLNEDIIKIFGTLEALDNILGNPELIFSPDYPDLDNLRNVYFNRLTDKMNLKQFFEFFKWFDTTIGDFIENVIPRKTKFLGTNFVIESHFLERPKMEYYYTEIYLGDNDRGGLKGTIGLSQYVGKIKKF